MHGLRPFLVVLATSAACRFHYAGVGWTQVQSPTIESLRNITGVPGAGMLAVGDNGVVLTHP